MNRILKSYCTQIDEAIADLGETLSDQARQVREQREAREKLLKEHWSRGRQIVTLQEDRDQFERLQAENRRLKAREQVLRDRLQSILKHTKNLSEGMRA